ncbi:MlaD family protein [Nocardioides sp. NPDC051685]|uniref:MlaD family protein n=1 Tax=Nocardioides sp. NPDC051685 TaxID=3364334 RepID=UPI0037882A8B
MSPVKTVAGGVRAVLTDPRLRTVVAFTLACAVGFGYLWVKSGGEIPVIASRSDDYRVTFEADDIKNLKDFGEVRVAGVRVGRVEATERDGDKVKVTLSIEDQAAPLHKGANVRVGVKSLVGSSFVELADGKGTELPDGSHLSGSAVTPAMDVDELLDTLDEPTRRHLGSALQGLDRATGDRGEDIDALMSGLGGTGREGKTVADALADQSKDLKQLTVETRVLLDALDTGEGQIVALVGDSQRLTQVTAANQKEIEESVRQLPTLVGNLETAAGSLSELNGSLAPIAADLRTAAPLLSSALVNLRPAARDLRALVPDLDGVLDAAPATLTRIEPFDETVQNAIPEARTTLADVQPMLSYLAPYGRDLGVLFASFGASFDQYAEDGVIPIRLTATAEGAGTVRGNPVPLVSSEKGGLLWNNPYPQPGDVDNPRPFGTGDYPRVKKAP